MNLGNVQVARTHQLPDVAIVIEQDLLSCDYHSLLIERLLSVARKLSQLVHFCLKRLSLVGRVLALLAEGNHPLGTIGLLE